MEINEKLQEFYNSFTFILSFMITLLIFNSIFGAKFVEVFLLLVLASMAVVNHEKIETLFNVKEK